MKPKLLLWLALVLSSNLFDCSGAPFQMQTKDGLPTNGANFTVSIVGQQQRARPFTTERLPGIYRFDSHSRPSAFVSSEYCFFVVIRNVGKSARTLTCSAFTWEQSLEFKVADHSGHTYSISRVLPPQSMNPIESWTFPPDGMRVIPIDFTRNLFTRGWSGLPPAPSEPELAIMTVTFRYPGSKGKMASVSSPPTEVYLCPKP
jgi:hypothetical protein